MRKIWQYTVVAASVVIGASFWWGHSYRDSYRDTQIVRYQADRDRQAILQLFEDNWEWLVAQSPQEYSAAYRIDNKAPSKKPADTGALSIDVFRWEDVTAGFIGYYMNTSYKGTVLFLAVYDAYRGRGIARRLLTHAIDQLKHRHVKYIDLVTRTDNYAAQRLYERTGFSPIKTTDRFVTYRYYIDD